MQLMFQINLLLQLIRKVQILKIAQVAIAVAVVVAEVVASQVLQMLALMKVMMRIQVKNQQMMNQLTVQPLPAVAVAVVQLVKV